MKVIDILNSRKSPFPSLEFVPPLKGSDINVLYQSLEPLMEFQPPFINITSHKEDVVYFEQKDGTMGKKTVSKRPGTVAIAAAVMKRFPIEVVPHIICAGMTKYQIENQLIDLDFLDIQNVMALRGDGDGEKKIFTPVEGGYFHTDKLVEQIKNLNEGKYLDSGLENPVHTDFCIGVAGYPEKHFEAESLQTDILNLKKKVDAGATHLVTQLFFDNNHFYEFMDKVEKAGIRVPIEAGIMPVINKAQIERTVSMCGARFPVKFSKMINKYANDPVALKDAGIAFATEQIIDLINNDVRGIHLYTMNNVDTATRITNSIANIIASCNK